MPNVVIYGAGAIARELYDYTKNDDSFFDLGSIVGYFSDNGVEPQFEQRTGLCFIDIFNTPYHSKLDVLLCVGMPKARQQIYQSLRERGYKILRWIHRTSVISASAEVGDGVILYPYTVVSSNAVLNPGVIVNSYSGIGHDVVVGEFATVSAHVDIMGGASLGQRVFMGSGSRVLPGKSIGSDSSVGSGIVVIRSLASNKILLPVAHRTILDKNNA